MFKVKKEKVVRFPSAFLRTKLINQGPDNKYFNEIKKAASGDAALKE
jgi:hypothetical protein